MRAARSFIIKLNTLSRSPAHSDESTQEGRGAIDVRESLCDPAHGNAAPGSRSDLNKACGAVFCWTALCQSQQCNSRLPMRREQEAGFDDEGQCAAGDSASHQASGQKSGAAQRAIGVVFDRIPYRRPPVRRGRESSFSKV